MVDDAKEAFLEGKVEKKSDKKKKKADSKEVDGFSPVVSNTMEDAVKLRKEDKRKKDKKDLEVSNDIGKKDDESVIHNHQEENSKRKKRRKLEHSEKSNTEIQVEKEEQFPLQADNIDDLGIDSKGKTKKKDKQKKRLEQDKSEEQLCLPTDDVNDLGNDNDVKSKKKGKKKKKKKKTGLGEDKSAEQLHLRTEDVNYLGIDSEVKTKKKEKKKRLKKDKSHSSQKQSFEVEDTDKDEIVPEQRSSGEDNDAVKNRGTNQEVCNLKGKKKTDAEKEVEDVADEDNVDVAEKVEKRKRKKEKKKSKDVSCAGRQETLAKDVGDESTDLANEKHDVEKVKRKYPGPTASTTGDLKAKKKAKKVSFSSEVEVFPAASESESKKKRTPKVRKERLGLVRGKRFTPEEDKIIKDAVMNYIQVHGLGEEGVEMVMHCSSHPKIKNCWNDIAAALPDRPKLSVYNRGHILFQRDNKTRKWTLEELMFVKKFYEEHGPKWKECGDLLGKHRVHVKDAWRRIKLPNAKKGNWSQDEYQNLFDLVNKDLRMKVYEEKKSGHGMLRDNIGWAAICDKIETRTDPTCCMKWYDSLSSPMVKEEIWADIDDYRMIYALYELDASCIEDVDWDNLLEHRSGDVCLRRWKQMYNHIGEHGCKSFADQVEVLSKRYCPELIEVREIWDNKPYVS